LIFRALADGFAFDIHAASILFHFAILMPHHISHCHFAIIRYYFAAYGLRYCHSMLMPHDIEAADIISPLRRHYADYAIDISLFRRFAISSPGHCCQLLSFHYFRHYAIISTLYFIRHFS
jgi:hypothetical protein